MGSQNWCFGDPRTLLYIICTFWNRQLWMNLRILQAFNEAMMERFSSKISCSYFLGFPTSNDIRLWQEEFWRARCHTSCDRPLIYSITRTYKDIDWPETIIPWVVFSDSVLDWQEICLFLELVSSYCVTTDHPKNCAGMFLNLGHFFFVCWIPIPIPCPTSFESKGIEFFQWCLQCTNNFQWIPMNVYQPINHNTKHFPMLRYRSSYIIFTIYPFETWLAKYLPRFSGARPSSSLHHIDRCTLRIPCESRLHSCPGSYLSVPMAFRKFSEWTKIHKNSESLVFCTVFLWYVSLQSASFWQRDCRWW